MILAEGIETEAQQEVARALGARYVQGWLYGRPGPLPAAAGEPPAGAFRLTPPRRRPRAEQLPTPFEVVSAVRPVRRGTKRLLLAISKHLEAQVGAHGESAVLLATFQEARHFTPATQGAASTSASPTARDLVVRAAEAMMARVASVPGP